MFDFGLIIVPVFNTSDKLTKVYNGKSKFTIGLKGADHLGNWSIGQWNKK